MSHLFVLPLFGEKMGKFVTFVVLSSGAEILLWPVSSTSSIRIIACIGICVRFTPSNSDLRCSSDGSTTKEDLESKTISSICMKPKSSLWTICFA